MKKTFNTISLYLMSPIFLFGCASISGDGSGWPIQSYGHVCNSPQIPNRPVCLYGDRFNYRDEFAACKESVGNFISGLDEYYRCHGSELKNTFNELIEKTVSTYNCYVDYIESRDSGDPSELCPPVEIPNFTAVHDADRLEMNLGVPDCVRKARKYSSALQGTFQISQCKSEVEKFVGQGIVDFRDNSAKSQYDRYMNSLRDLLDRKGSEAVTKFNCMAEGKKYCI